jgi:hypothetical protein
MSHNEMMAYMNQLTPLEQKVLQIAASHLETSFSLVKSIGFQEWQAQQQQAQQQQAQQQVPKVQQAPVPQVDVKEPVPNVPQPPPLKKLKIKKKLTPTRI